MTPGSVLTLCGRVPESIKCLLDKVGGGVAASPAGFSAGGTPAMLWDVGHGVF